MYRDFFGGNNRYQLTNWTRQQENVSQAKDAVAELSDARLIRVSMSQGSISALGIEKVEGSGLLDPEEVQTNLTRRKLLLAAVAEIQAASPRGMAQIGRVLTQSKLSENVAMANIVYCREKGWIEATGEGFYQLQDVGFMALDELRNQIPDEAEPEPEPPSEGPLPLSAIKFFD